MTSRQEKWQRTQVAAGKCRSCGRKKKLLGVYCEKCRSKNRKRLGHVSKKRCGKCNGLGHYRTTCAA